MKQLLNHSTTLIAAALVGTIALVWLATIFTAVQALLGLIVVLILPGYVLVELLMGRRTLDTLQHLFMTLCASLAIAILGGLMLNQFPLGLRMNGWLAIFVSTIASGALLTWFLRHRRRSAAIVAHRVPVRTSQLLFLGIAALIAVQALFMARTPAPAEHFSGYTMLWMTPIQGADANQLQLGIDSKEFSATGYRLELMVDEAVAQEWTQIELAPNQQWHANLALNSGALTTETLTANLYRLDAPDKVYRHVVLRPRVSAAQE